MAMHTMMGRIKYDIPLKILAKGISGAKPFITYALTPTGGLITPTPLTKTIITPNQMGSNPNFRTTGNINGIVSTIKAIASMKSPPKK
jgi:hypothetical protein